MARARISTTVDADLLADARRVSGGIPDGQLIDEALVVLVASHRSAEIDAAYAADPIEQTDNWGDFDSFRKAAAAT